MSKVIARQVMPIITVESADKARNFFVDTLGFDHVMGVLGKDGQLDFVTVVLNGARLMFARPHDKLPIAKAGNGKQPVEIYLEVDDVETYHSALKKKKLRVIPSTAGLPEAPRQKPPGTQNTCFSSSP